MKFSSLSGTSGLSRPLSVKIPLGRLSQSKTSGAKSASKTSSDEESLEKCSQNIVENSVSLCLRVLALYYMYISSLKKMKANASVVKSSLPKPLRCTCNTLRTRKSFWDDVKEVFLSFSGSTQ